MDQAQIAALTEERDSSGVVTSPAIGKSFISAMLYGRSKVGPENYKRLARALQVNVVHFHIAEGWEDISDAAAFDLPDRDLTLPIIRKLMELPVDQRPHGRAVVLAVLDSIYAAHQAASAPQPQETTPVAADNGDTTHSKKRTSRSSSK